MLRKFVRLVFGVGETLGGEECLSLTPLFEEFGFSRPSGSRDVARLDPEIADLRKLVESLSNEGKWFPTSRAFQIKQHE